MDTEERLLREAHADPEHQRLHGRECRVCWLLRQLDDKDEPRKEVACNLSFPDWLRVHRGARDSGVVEEFWEGA